jgi:hypothetical protein
MVVQNVNEPEVLTGHTDVICSTSIERIVTGRNAALTRIESLISELDDISILTHDMAVVQYKSGDAGGPSLRLLVHGKTR